VSDSVTVNLHYESHGIGNPMVFVHGFGANLFTWRYIVPQFSPNFQTIALDLKGSGKSPKPPDKRYAISDHVEAVKHLIDSLELDRIIFVGHSYGGAVVLSLAAEFALTQPDRLQAMIIIAGAAYPQKLPGHMGLLKLPASEFGFRLLPAEFITKKVLMNCYYNHDLITPEVIKGYADPMKLTGSAHAMAYTVRQIIPDHANDASDKYHHISIPSLLIWGKCDHIVPLEIGTLLHKDLSQSELFLLDECGHVPPEEKPTETNQLIRTFLNQHACI
jgi:pimeloyl-ACP methyl ester carboxylesterase